ncbi:glycosyltransferase [Flavihumibacter sediminis]|nr:glycosyltransferase [Flavihumibacter sediminis]
MINGHPLISICIPAYKRIDYLQRLLASIEIQTFRDFEVVITDDSPDASVGDFCRNINSSLNLHYFKNEKALGTPENWNEGIRQARGKWIKLMHDDDWFTDENSLEAFYQATLKDPDCPFFFSAFRNVDEDSGRREVVQCNALDLAILRLSPLHLFKKVYVGNPSCTLIRRDIGLLYDSRFKYVVDFEYYIRCIQKEGKWKYIDNVLLQIGFNAEQVTKYTFLVKEVQIPENHLLLQTMGVSILRNYFVFDYYWRLYRNLGIRKPAEISALYEGPVLPIVKTMLEVQSSISPSVLKNGIVSKLLMTATYIRSLLIKP